MRTVLAAAAAVALLAPAAGASSAPHISDPRGDANAVNGQGAVPRDVNVSLPATADSYDLLGVRFTTYRTGRRPAGFTVTVALAGPPKEASTFVVKASSQACKEIWLEYVIGELGDTVADLRHRCGATGPADPATYVPIRATANGTLLAFTVPLAALPRGVGVGATLGGLSAESRTFVGVVSAPVVDQARSDATYRVGG